MADELEALGDTLTGALAARAVEPAPGGAGHTSEAECLNCDAVLMGPHCHRCGQRAHVHKTIGAFFHDLLHGVFHFEGKIWHTLPLLAWRPGRLTREYIDGRRARYVSPIALFLFCVFLLFATFQFTANTGLSGVEGSLGEAIVTQKRHVAEIEKRRAAVEARNGSAAELATIDELLAAEREELAQISKLDLEGADGFKAQFKDAKFNSTIPWIDSALKHAQANPELMAYKLQTSAYKYSWLLIPISVPFLWLLFPFSRRFGLYDHTVFVTYSLAFMILLLIAANLIGWAGAGSLAMWALLVPPVHIYRQLREGYALSRAGALVRLVLMLFVCVAAVFLFVMSVLSLGLL